MIDRHPGTVRNTISGSHAFGLLVLLFICFWSLYFDLGVIEIDSMEARNLVAAREINENGNWLVPTMNGEIRLAKPPLPTWLAALVSRSVGGTHDLSLLRLPNAVSATLLVLLVYGFTWTLTKNRTTSLAAGVMLATNLVLMNTGQRASWDVFCHTFMLGALWAFVAGFRNDRGWPVFCAAGACLGLAFLSKGPVAFYAMLLPFLVSYLWIFRFEELKRTWPLFALALAIGIVISSLWPAYIYFGHQEALLATVDKESGSWISKHVKSLWYYLSFPLHSGVWIAIVVAALIKPFAEKRCENARDYRFVLLWFVLAMVLLTILPMKKTRYLLPAMVPMSILGAMLFQGIVNRYRQGIQDSGSRLLMILQNSVVSFLALLLPLALLYRLDDNGVDPELSVFLLIYALLLALVIACWYLLKKRNLMGLFFLTTLQFCVFAFVFMHFYRDVAITNPQYQEISRAEQIPREIDIYLMEPHDGLKYVWDLKRTIKHWDFKEVKKPLKQGKTIAVISTGDPSDELVAKFGEAIEVEVIDRFDYATGSPQEEMSYLSLVRLRKS